MPEPPPTGPSPATTTPVPRAGRALPHFPALDGLRGLAVAAVVCFHGGFSWAEGGFLGVSTFFTLSGFLITSLLVTERQASGGVDLRAFWVRRFRRLLPAALAGIALALLFGLVAADPSQREELFGDVAASLAYVANWWFLGSDQSYAELFSAPSPLLHYWSLAIEEQFYLLFPVVVWLCVRRPGSHVRRLVLVVGGATIATAALPLVVRWSDDAIYYATPTRASELLVGSVLALALHHRPVASALARRRSLQVAASAAGVVALAIAVVAWAVTPQSASWLYAGGFSAYAVVSAAIVLAALVPGSPVAVVLSARPLRHLGLVSYGVYVYHWPVFLWLDPARTGLDGAALFAVRVAVALALAEASARWLEHPVRRGQHLAGRRPSVLAAPAMAGLVAVALLLSVTAPPPAVDLAAAEAQLEDASMTVDVDVDPVAADTADPPRPRMAVFGDSTALMTATGLQRWADAGGEVDFVPGSARLGCGVSRAGLLRGRDGRTQAPMAHCDDWPRTWAEKVRTFAPTLSVVQVGPWELFDRQLPGEQVWRALGDPVYDAWLLDELTAVIDTLTVDGGSVVWLTTPPVAGAGESGAALLVEPDVSRARSAHLNDLLGQLPSLRPGQVEIVDLAAWLAVEDPDDALRPDGVHFSLDGAHHVASTHLGPALVAAHDRLWEAGRRARLDAVAARPAPEVVLPDDRPLRLLVWGDGAAAPIGEALAAAAASRPDVELEVATAATADCGLARPDRRRVIDTEVDVPQACRDRFVLHQALDATDPDAVLVVGGRWEVADQLVGGEAQSWRAPGDGFYDDWLRAELGEVADQLHADRRAVLWATVPDYAIDGDDASDPQRSRRVTAVVGELVAAPSRQPWSATVDLVAWLRTHPGGQLAPDLRPDGIALSPSGAAELAPWLLDAVIEELDALRTPGG